MNIKDEPLEYFDEYLCNENDSNSDAMKLRKQAFEVCGEISSPLKPCVSVFIKTEDEIELKIDAFEEELRDEDYEDEIEMKIEACENVKDEVHEVHTESLQGKLLEDIHKEHMDHTDNEILTALSGRPEWIYIRRLVKDTRMAPHSAQDNDNAGNRPIIVNELLCFVLKKMDIMPEDDIIKVCTDFYNEGQVKEAKQLLWDSCDDAKFGRLIFRNGSNSKLLNMRDMLKVLHAKGTDVPRFVAENLDLVPPVSLDRIDVSSLLASLRRVERKVQCLADDISQQKSATSELNAKYDRNTGKILENERKIKGIIDSENKATGVNNLADHTRENSKMPEMLTHTGTDEVQPSVSHLASSIEQQAVRPKTSNPGNCKKSGDQHNAVNTGNIANIEYDKIAAKRQEDKDKIEGDLSDNGTVNAGMINPEEMLNNTIAGSDSSYTIDENLTWTEVVKKTKKVMDMHQTSAAIIPAPMSHGARPQPIQPRKRPMYKRKVIAGSRDSHLGVEKPPLEIFASRFKPNLEATQVKKFIEDLIKYPIECEKLNTLQNNYSSFKIRVTCEPNLIYDPAIWPMGVIVRKFYSKRNVQSGEMITAST